MTASVDLILSHEDLAVIEDLLRDVNIQARAWGVTIERRPVGGLGRANTRTPHFDPDSRRRMLRRMRREREGERMPEQMTTKKCRVKGCHSLVLYPGHFGYRCELTGEVPRNMGCCPKVLPPSTPSSSDLAQVPTCDLVAELTRREGVHEVLVDPHTYFEIFVDSDETELPYCEGPCRILVVGD